MEEVGCLIVFFFFFFFFFWIDVWSSVPRVFYLEW